MRNPRAFRWLDSDLKLFRFQLNLFHKSSSDRNKTEKILTNFDTIASFNNCLLQVFDEPLHTIGRSFQFETDRFRVVVLDYNQAKSTRFMSLFNIAGTCIRTVGTCCYRFDERIKVKIHNIQCEPPGLVILKYLVFFFVSSGSLKVAA